MLKKRVTNKDGNPVYHEVKVSVNSAGYFNTEVNGEIRMHHNLYDLMKFLSLAADGKYIGQQTYQYKEDNWVKTTNDLIPIMNDEYF